MPGTSTKLRQAPARVFENYTFTRLVDASAGLTNISDTQFTQMSGVPDYTGFNIGQGLCDDGYSSATTPALIGFNFSFDNLTYTQFVANANGWMVLVDPHSGSFTPTEVLLGTVDPSESGIPSPPPWVNGNIKPTFGSNAVLLAPWFDDLRNVTNKSSQLTSTPFNYSNAQVAQIDAGLLTPPIFLNPSSYGVSYFNDIRSTKGRRLIVRWSSASNYTSPESVLKFEVVIYESGLIEYRYTPRIAINKPPVGSQFEGATIGIFMPKGTNRWRDFSKGLGYRDSARQEYDLGGYVYNSSYSDSVSSGNEDFSSTAAYNISLTPYNNWPGQTSDGCIMSFSPPTRLRTVLPRLAVRNQDAKLLLPLVARTGDDRLGTSPISFDDRLSPTYAISGSSPTAYISYPSTLPRLFGGNAVGTLQRQNLFASGNIFLTGSIVKSAVDQFLREEPQHYVSPFNESRRYEQDEATLSSNFYMTGTSNQQIGPGFEQPLKSKTHIRIQLPVNIGMKMQSVTSSIYYYNAGAKCWEVPANSKPGADWANPQVDAANGRVIEDARGFGPIGNIVSSGSNTPVSGSLSQTSTVIGTTYSLASTANVLTTQFPKSVRNNDEYRPTSNETFTLPITAPFLIEKMVIELPMAAGPGWFEDQTTSFLPLNFTPGGGHFDFAGPAMTVALSRNIKLSETSDSPAMRDLILTGTITHQFDNIKSLVMSAFPPDAAAGTFVIRPVGFLSYAGPAGAVVNPPSNSPTTSFFTGSVKVQCQALSAVGPVLRFNFSFGGVSAPANTLFVLTQEPNVDIQHNQALYAYISPFGRGGTSFDPSGRCVLGNEFVTLQGLPDPSGATTPNPFYVGPSGLTQQMSGALLTPSFAGVFTAALPLISHFPAPYLVMPGDELVLSISKMRPFVYSGLASALSGSMIGHDVQLMPGNINITLYGSQIANNVEYHDTLNQPLASDAVHELIGAEPILDQFDVAYRNEYTGSFTDNVVLGNMLTTTIIGGKIFFSQGTRERVFSALNPPITAPLSTNIVDTSINPFKSFRAQPAWETVGSVRMSQFIDNTERYWDSLMPAIDQCFLADGTGIFLRDNSFYGSSIDPAQSTGWIVFDDQAPHLIGEGFSPTINTNWTKAFPFETRYQGASRQLDIAKSFNATYKWAPGLPGIKSITPTLVSGLIIGVAYSPSFESIGYTWFSDCDLTKTTIVTGSATTNDISRILYGFGDFNSVSLYTDSNAPYIGQTVFLGNKNFANPRKIDNLFGDGFGFSPEIRGWKYGIHSGIPTFSKSYWRRNRFGQFRDMLEQRQYAKYYESPENGPINPKFKQGVKLGVVTVKFVSADGKLTQPSNTWSSNLDFECTSSIPFFDGIPTNRPPTNLQTLNKSVISFNEDTFRNITVASPLKTIGPDLKDLLSKQVIEKKAPYRGIT